MRRWIGIGVALVIVTTGVVATARESDPPKIIMREQVFGKLSRAQKAVEEQDYDRAFKYLEDIEKMNELEPYEQAQLFNAYGVIYSIQEKYAESIGAYQRVLEQEGLPAVMLTTTLYTLAQLQFQLTDYEAAVGYLERWLEHTEDPAPESYVLIGQGYYQLERYREAVPHVERALEVSRQREQPVKESWYVLLRGLYHHLGEQEKLIDVLEILVTRFPSKEYWLHLASVHGEMENHADQLAVYKIAHAQGHLDRGRELLLMSQLLLQAQVPYRAGVILSQGLEDGLIESNAKHYRLLSQAWILAHEDRKAIDALKEASALSNDGEIDARLALSYAKLDNWSESVDAARRALRAGVRDAHELQVTLGMALYELERYDEAKQAFRQAQKASESRATATKWINYIESEERRLRDLRASLE